MRFLSFLPSFLSLSLIWQDVGAAKPPKEYCRPNSELIASITDLPWGKSFCSSLQSHPRTVTTTVTATEPLTTTDVYNVTATGTQWTTHWLNTTSTASVTNNLTVTATLNTTTTTTAPPSLTTILSTLTTTLTTTSTIITTRTRDFPIDRAASAVLTIHVPPSFPVPSSYIDRLLAERSLAKRQAPQKRQETTWLPGVPNTSVTSACDCIVGWPTSSVTVTETTTVPSPTITATSTAYQTGVYTTHTTATGIWNTTIITNMTTTLYTTATTTETLYTTLTSFLNATVTATQTLNATATAYPDCAGLGYIPSGFTGHGNRVDILTVDGGPVQCCERCQVTPDCVANAMVGFQCQLLVNDLYTPPEHNRTLQCPLGHEDYPFGNPVEGGVIYAGPCGY